MRLSRYVLRARKTLAFRFFVISGLAVAALVPVRLLEIRAMRDQAVQDGNVAVSRIADGGIARLREIIDESKIMLTVTALLPTFADPASPDCHAVLTPMVVETAWMNSLSAVDAHGTIICSSTSTAEGLWIGDRSYFQKALLSQAFDLSDLVRSRRSQTPVLLAALPVRFPQSATAALVMSINASWFSETAESAAHSAPGGIAMIIDGSGNVLGQSKSGAADDPSPDAIRAEISHFDRANARPVTFAQDRTFVVAVREIPYSSSLLVIGVPQDELHRHVLAAERNLYEDLLIAVAVIVLVFWLGHESCVRPVTTLASAARRLGRGKFDITIRSGDWASEFQVLAEAITRAAANLAERAQADAQVNADLRAQSHEDPLTGLKNRRGLDEYVEMNWQACRETGAPFAAIAFDVDFFKQYNDVYGHDAGDQALRFVGRIIADQAAQAGGLAARTGGEEFTVVIPGQSETGARALAEAVALRVAASRMEHLGSPLGLLTASAGLASARASVELTPSDVFRAADRALYGAKSAGRNTITIGSVAMPGLPDPADGDTGGKRSGSARDRPDRVLTAFPSAMSL